jgi:hypothetical protein
MISKTIKYDKMYYTNNMSKKMQKKKDKIIKFPLFQPLFVKNGGTINKVYVFLSDWKSTIKKKETHRGQLRCFHQWM